MTHRLAQHQKSFVLLSGGIDSSTCLGLAKAYHDKEGGSVEAVSINYGQRHVREADCAKELCDHYGVPHTVLKAIGALGNDSMLTDASIEVPDISYDQIKGVSPTYVPFRNGFMLSLITAHAQRYVNSIIHEMCSDDPTFPIEEATDLCKDLCTIYFGAHAEDAKNWAYPDCTPEFVGAMTNAIHVGTYYAVRLLVPFTYSSKSDIIRTGTRLDVPYALTWSCYKGEELHCGVCPTCRARKLAFEEAGVEDPTEYAA
jgi:7-cyano-7-deazaguanine synthase